jgi:predicted nucleic acid-binding protein
VSELVVDASAIVKALGYKDTVGIAGYQRVVNATCHAPHLLDAEVGQVLCRAERIGEITEETARTALAALPTVVENRYPHTGRFADMAWQTRHTITLYDGLYVALATVLELPLLTSDAKLANARGLSCEVELIG